MKTFLLRILYGIVGTLGVLFVIAVMFWLVFGALAAPRTTRAPMPTPTAIKWASVDTPDYREFFRHAEQYDGQPVIFMGEVVQAMDGCYRVAIEKSDYGWDYDSIVYVCGRSDVRILEDDVIQIFGLGSGIVKYETVLGATVEVPAVAATRIVVYGN